MRLITYNIEYGQGINKKWKYLELQRYFLEVKKNLKKIAESLKEYNPDVVGLVEVDMHSFQVKERSPVGYLASRLNMDNQASNRKYGPRSVYGLLNLTPIMRKHANAIIAKKPMKNTHFHYLSKGAKRLVIHTQVEGINMFVVHLSLRRATRVAQLKDLAMIVNSVSAPKVVFGDFNIFKGGREIEDFMERTGLMDVVFEPTYPSWKPKHVFDKVFIKGLKVRKVEVLPIHHSDHLPVLVDFE